MYLSLSSVVLLYALTEGWKEEARGAAPSRRSGCSRGFLFRRTWVPAELRIWHVLFLQSTLPHLLPLFELQLEIRRIIYLQGNLCSSQESYNHFQGEKEQKRCSHIHPGQNRRQTRQQREHEWLVHRRKHKSADASDCQLTAASRLQDLFGLTLFPFFGMNVCINMIVADYKVWLIKCLLA